MNGLNDPCLDKERNLQINDIYDQSINDKPKFLL